METVRVILFLIHFDGRVNRTSGICYVKYDRRGVRMTSKCSGLSSWRDRVTFR